VNGLPAAVGVDAGFIGDPYGSVLFGSTAVGVHPEQDIHGRGLMTAFAFWIVGFLLMALFLINGARKGLL